MRRFLLAISLFASGCLVELDEAEEVGETESSIEFCDDCTPELSTTLLSKPNLSGADGAWSLVYGVYPKANRRVRIKIEGGTGDADLYVRRNLAPGSVEYDCRPYLPGNNESCLQVIGSFEPKIYVALHGYESYAGVTLTAKYE